jgi:hypothetical protein
MRRDDDIARAEAWRTTSLQPDDPRRGPSRHAFFDDNLANGQPVHEGVALDLAARDIEALTPRLRLTVGALCSTERG